MGAAVLNLHGNDFDEYAKNARDDFVRPSKTLRFAISGQFLH
jgi:hypothetical protein